MLRFFPLVFLFLLALVPARADSVLVLPFFNVSNTAASVDWIGESVSETIRESLYTRGLLVVDREDRQEVYHRLSLRPGARLTRASVLKLGEALDAGTVVYGEFEFVKEQNAAAPNVGLLRIVAHVLDMKRLQQYPELNASGPLEDLTRLQTRIAWQAMRLLEPDTPPEQEFAREHPPVRIDAMENYVRGLMSSDPEQKHRFFTQAARLDADFSQPEYELGRFHWTKKEYALAASWFGKMKPGAPHYMEANFLLGLCRYYTGDYAGAQAALELVSASVPLSEVFNDLGAVQSRRNSPDALANFEKALEGDQADPDYHFNVGYALWKKGDFTRAAERFRAVLSRNPEDTQATLLLGRCLKQNGPRSGDPQSAGLERLKHNFEERAFNELKAALGKKEAGSQGVK